MGFRPNRRLDLVFNDPEWEGLEVVARRPDFATYFEMKKLTADSEGTQHAISLFAPYLLEWNVEDDRDGTPVPATPEGLQTQDPDMVIAILNAWIYAVEGVPGPLDQPSPDGGQLAEASIPMASLSEPQAS